jgi:hypothetical protein
VSQSARTKKAKDEKADDVRTWLLEAMRDLWPVADGSLSLRKSPCVRTNCAACAAGEGHRSYVLYGRRGGQRHSLYVPEELVGDIQLALENGRRLKDLISIAGERYAHALKNERRSRSDMNRGD